MVGPPSLNPSALWAKVLHVCIDCTPRQIDFLSSELVQANEPIYSLSLVGRGLPLSSLRPPSTDVLYVVGWGLQEEKKETLMCEK